MFFTKLWKTLMMGVRVLKNNITKPFRALSGKLRRSTDLSRKAATSASKAAKGMTKVNLKPKTKEDYIETKSSYIAKPLIFLIVIGALAVGALLYFVAWPLCQSWFFVKHMPANADAVSDYNGRVVLYYDEEKTQKEYEGRLKAGIFTGTVNEYYKNGEKKYEGLVEDGLYSGTGKLYDETGELVYDGSFSGGVYFGQGTLYENGVRLYQGGFADGLYDGTGTEYKDGDIKVYEGGYSAGVRSGQCNIYDEGKLVYQGGYQATAYSGDGKLFYSNGALAAEGTFSNGLLTGSGSDYYDNGSVKYRGMFNLGIYEGTGTMYRKDGTLEYKGDFAGGLYEGTGTLYHEDGKTKKFSGDFAAGEAFGENVSVFDENGELLYKGGMKNGEYDGSGTLYIGERSWIEGIFSGSQAEGAVKLYENNMLYYEGGYVNGLFEGTGKLYNEVGDVLYNGAFTKGLPDLSAFLGQPVEQIYALFGEGKYKEYPKEDGTLIVNTSFDMAAFVCFSSVEPEIPSVVHRMYFYDDTMLDEYTLDTLELPAEGKIKDGALKLVQIDGIDRLNGSKKNMRKLTTKDWFFTVWEKEDGNGLMLMEYKSTVPLPEIVVGAAVAATP